MGKEERYKVIVGNLNQGQALLLEATFRCNVKAANATIKMEKE